MEETISRTNNPVKDRILDIYLNLCNSSAHIRNMILSGSPGNKKMVFQDFRKQMFELYSLSHRYDRINKEKVNQFSQWMANKQTNPTNEFMIKSLKLFESYIDELVRIEVIKV